MKTYQFKSPTGRDVTLTAGDKVYGSEINLDGQATGVYDKAIELVVEELTIDGIGTYCEGEIRRSMNHQGKEWTKVVTTRDAKRNLFLIVPIPDDVFEEIYAGKAARMAKAKVKPEPVDPNFCQKCQSYCWGDCEA